MGIGGFVEYVANNPVAGLSAQVAGRDGYWKASKANRCLLWNVVHKYNLTLSTTEECVMLSHMCKNFNASSDNQLLRVHLIYGTNFIATKSRKQFYGTNYGYEGPVMVFFDLDPTVYTLAAESDRELPELTTWFEEEVLSPFFSALREYLLSDDFLTHVDVTDAFSVDSIGVDYGLRHLPNKSNDPDEPHQVKCSAHAFLTGVVLENVLGSDGQPFTMKKFYQLVAGKALTDKRLRAFVGHGDWKGKSFSQEIINSLERDPILPLWDLSVQGNKRIFRGMMQYKHDNRATAIPDSQLRPHVWKSALPKTIASVEVTTHAAHFIGSCHYS